MKKYLETHAFLSIIAVALVLRLFVFLYSQPWEHSWDNRVLYTGDPFEYLTLARSLVERHEFSVTWPEPMPNGVRTPGYPLFLSLTCQGQTNLMWISVLAQVVLDSLFSGLFAVIATRCFRSHKVGILSGFLYAVFPDAVFWPTQIFPESIGVWFAVGGVGLLERFASGNCKHFWQQTTFALSGCLLLGLAVLIKPNWLFLPFVAAIWISYHIISRPQGSRIILTGALCILFAPMTSWVCWNKYNWGNWTINYGSVMFKESISSSLINKNGSSEIPISKVWSDEMKLQALVPDFNEKHFVPPSFLRVTTWNKDSLSRDTARVNQQYKRVILENFPEYLKMHAGGIAYLLFSPGSNFVAKALDPKFEMKDSSANFATSQKSLVEILHARLLDVDASWLAISWTGLTLAYLCVLYLFSLIFAGIFYTRGFSASLLGGPWLIYVLVSGISIILIGAGGTSRYRYGLVAAMIPYASFAIIFAIEHLRKMIFPKSSSDLTLSSKMANSVCKGCQLG
ncbi:MAG: hypothetical protein ACOYM3_00755 [Terrimicrobiaceae bacterium]